MQAHKFSPSARAEKPTNADTQLLERIAQNPKNINREDKDRLAKILYGLFSQQSPVYKLGGWAWDMRPYLNKYLVKIKFLGWEEFYGLDRTSLRNVLACQVQEITEVENKFILREERKPVTA